MRAASTVVAPVLTQTGVNTELKMKILISAAALDRGQSYNPTSSDAYRERMEITTSLMRELIAASPPLPTNLAALDGEWELVFTNVAHGIFRSSPFFLAIQEAYANAGAPDKAELFFKLHELQTCSWGVSKIGRVAQTIDAATGRLYSEFDTNLLSLTVIPILGWFKLLPTFGGCVITASSAALNGDKIDMEVLYTTSRPVPGLSGLRPLPGDLGKQIAQLIWSLKVPVGFVWKLLPWNQGRAPTCSVKLVYFDGDIRIVEDRSGELFLYARPVAPRPLAAKIAEIEGA
ncbi:pili assembly chaperone [Chrysochromulina tobinii]|uniref:Pili assembly chaperone n=1 Tax=Chrysochromulina tobinii TaxID=1460289 RepID=A0A0M0JAH9_9EUKA|nr:pili assembly chaperone [Chrysochromulina tobinii]|eukprot:KOO23367.1 pili assembly chaperone [Chrysochromulina sp. CCMP291]